MQINVFNWGVYQGGGTCTATKIFKRENYRGVEVFNFGMDNVARVPWPNGFNPPYSETCGKEK